MRRIDPELGIVRRCQTCREEWPDTPEFFQKRYASCRACRKDIANGRAIPLRAMTHGATIDREAKRRRDRERKAALRRDPVLGDKLRARQRAAQRRYYERHWAVCLERSRARYASLVGRPVREGFGRPRVAA